MLLICQYTILIGIIIHNVNWADVLSERSAREGKKSDTLTLKCQYPKQLANDGQKFNVFISSEKYSSGTRSLFSFFVSNICPHLSTLVFLHNFSFVSRAFSWPALTACIWYPTTAQQQLIRYHVKKKKKKKGFYTHQSLLSICSGK